MLSTSIWEGWISTRKEFPDEFYPHDLMKTHVLNCLPKSGQAKAKQALHNIWQAQTRVEAEKAFDLFIKTYEPKYPKAALCLHQDHDELMAFYDFPAPHWQSIRTSNPIESSFGTIRHLPAVGRSDQAFQGLLVTRWDAAYDVQAWAVCREEVETLTRFRLSGQGDNQNQIQRWNRGDRHRSGRRLMQPLKHHFRQ